MAHFQSEKYPSVYRKHVHVHDSNYFSSFVFVDATQTRVCVCVCMCVQIDPYTKLTFGYLYKDFYI